MASLDKLSLSFAEVFSEDYRAMRQSVAKFTASSRPAGGSPTAAGAPSAPPATSAATLARTTCASDEDDEGFNPDAIPADISSAAEEEREEQEEQEEQTACSDSAASSFLSSVINSRQLSVLASSSTASTAAPFHDGSDNDNDDIPSSFEQTFQRFADLASCGKATRTRAGPHGAEDEFLSTPTADLSRLHDDEFAAAAAFEAAFEDEGLDIPVGMDIDDKFLASCLSPSKPARTRRDSASGDTLVTLSARDLARVIRQTLQSTTAAATAPSVPLLTSENSILDSLGRFLPSLSSPSQESSSPSGSPCKAKRSMRIATRQHTTQQQSPYARPAPAAFDPHRLPLSDIDLRVDDADAKAVASTLQSDRDYAADEIEEEDDNDNDVMENDDDDDMEDDDDDDDDAEDEAVFQDAGPKPAKKAAKPRAAAAPLLTSTTKFGFKCPVPLEPHHESSIRQLQQSMPTDPAVVAKFAVDLSRPTAKRAWQPSSGRSEFEREGGDCVLCVGLVPVSSTVSVYASSNARLRAFMQKNKFPVPAQTLYALDKEIANNLRNFDDIKHHSFKFSGSPTAYFRLLVSSDGQLYCRYKFHYKVRNIAVSIIHPCFGISTPAPRASHVTVPFYLLYEDYAARPLVTKSLSVKGAVAKKKGKASSRKR